MTFPSLARRTALLLFALGVAASFFTLAFVRFSNDLDQALARGPQDLPLSTVPQPLLRAMTAFHDPRFNAIPTSSAAGPTEALAAQLASEQSGKTAAFKRAAFAVLLRIRYTREERVVHYLNRICLGAVKTTPVCGFSNAAQSYFGVSIENLNLGEALLLCNLTRSHPGDRFLSDLPAALETRNRLLARSRDIGHLSPAEYETEVARPLSPASDHRPIW